MMERARETAHKAALVAKKIAIPPPAANDSGRLVVTTAAELEAMVERAVAAAVGGRPEPTQKLVDKQIMAQLIGCSAAHIDTLRRRGLPTVSVGVAVRFDPADVIAWLMQGGGEAPRHEADE